MEYRTYLSLLLFSSLEFLISSTKRRDANFHCQRPMVFAPLSEVPAVGRNWVYMPSFLLYVILQVPTALVNNIAGLVILRFITGLVAAPPLANGAASVGDVFNGHGVSYAIPLWAVATVFGPSMGPLIGSVFTQVLNWRYTFWALSWIGAVSFLFLLFLFPETNSDTILSRRARRLRIATGDNSYSTIAEREMGSFTLSEFAKESLTRPLVIAFLEPGVFFLNTYTALVYAVVYTFFEAFPLVFGGVYGFNLIETGLTYSGICAGVLVGYVFYAAALKYYFLPHTDADGPPELIFYVSLYAAFLMPVSLIIIGWTSTVSVHWIVPIIGTGLFIISGFHIFQVVFTYLGLSYPRYLASTFAGNDLYRSIFAAAFPLFARAMFVKLGSEKFPVAWGNTLLAGISALMILIPVMLLHLGARLRAVSKYAN